MKPIMVTKNLIVNLDQVTHMEFTPHRPAGEYDGEYFGDRPAKLKMVMTSVLAVPQYSDMSGEFQGVTNESRLVCVYGPDAETAWQTICEYTTNSHRFREAE
ncbi:MAG: hypothetical protein NZM11_00810 [Anaerolineales bacterium]|nr:hypothetical protein [Anaerolineales bacterium]